MKNFTRNLSISLALIGGAAAAPLALAEESYTLSFEPAEVRSAEGMQRLHAQIRQVAKDYCPDYQVGNFREVNSCVKDVSADLVSKVAIPEFSEFVQNKSRRTGRALIASTN